MAASILPCESINLELQNMSKITTAVNVDQAAVTFTGGGQSITIRAADLSPEITTLALLHGLKQKVGDAGAKAAGATVSEKMESMRIVADRLTRAVDPSWNASREGQSKESVLTLAIFRHYERAGKPKQMDALKAYLDGLGKPALSKLKAQFADLLLEIEAERLAAGKGDDSEEMDDLQDELDAL